MIDRVTAAYGGRKALDRCARLSHRGLGVLDDAPPDAPTIRVFAQPAQLKVLIDYASGAEARPVDGAKGRRNEAGGALEPVTGPMYAAMVAAGRARRRAVGAVRARGRSRVHGLAHAGGRALRRDPASARRGLVLRAWIDPRRTTSRSQGLLQHGGMRTHFETVYSTSAPWTA